MRLIEETRDEASEGTERRRSMKRRHKRQTERERERERERTPPQGKAATITATATTTTAVSNRPSLPVPTRLGRKRKGGKKQNCQKNSINIFYYSFFSPTPPHPPPSL